MPRVQRAACSLSLIFLGLLRSLQADEDSFERQIRPLLIERCHKCHAGAGAKGGLRLDTLEAVLTGGDSGPAIVAGQPEESLLVQAIRHQNGLKMPPDGKLSAVQVEAMVSWVRDGAAWTRSATSTTSETSKTTATVLPKSPSHVDLANSLQLWLRADTLQVNDGDHVFVWPDQSGRGRDLSATRGIREGGTGEPASFVRNSTLTGRPAVRFSPATGMASSPGNPVEIRGDAELTITIVVNLTQFEGQPSHASVFCVGNPAHSGDPGKPLAGLIEIDQTQQHSLDFAGGWGHDATAGPASFQPLFGQPVMITIVKQRGPIKDTTRFYINGTLAGNDPERNLAPASASGSSADPASVTGKTLIPAPDPGPGSSHVPDIQHRSDIGVFLGKALEWCGAIQGDIGEVLVYNSALSEADRLGVETYLAEKFGLWVDEERTVARKPVYTDAEKSHWAYQPLHRADPPNVQDDAWVRNPVDQFTLAALRANAMTPALATDKRELLRRVTFDLTGLPPTLAEMDAFLADTSPQAFDAVVTRLLESPRYGERWGRHWLDLVRYAESTANDANAVMGSAWRYRNYVIDAFNSDLPFDQFLIEQLAGDLLPQAESVAINTRRIIATGYLMIGPKALAETDKEQSRLDIVDDQIDVTGRAMLGLTLACARCHDHKFDAVRTTDYYALAGIFRSTEPFQNEVRNATMWWEFPVPQEPGAAPLMVMAPKESLPRNLRVHLRGNRFTLGRIVPRNVPGIVAAVSVPHEHDSPSIIHPHQLSSGRLELARWIASPSNPLTARVLVNRVWQLHFGRGIVGTPDNFGTRGERPSDPALLDWLTLQFLQNGWSIKQLHRLIVLSNTYQMQNAARGRLLHDSPADTKSVQGRGPGGHQSDLSAYQVHRRRLSAEELRDALLQTSGQLDFVPGSSESGDFLISKSEDINAMIRPNRVSADDDFYTTFRKRSVYLPIVRNMLPDVLALFDAADPNGVTAVRNETTVASQGLFLLNHPFVRQQLTAFADRLLANGQTNVEQRIELAHRLTFGRSATREEIEDSTVFLKLFQESSAIREKSETERQVAAWAAFCQSLFCSNEFLYVE